MRFRCGWGQENASEIETKSPKKMLIACRGRSWLVATTQIYMEDIFITCRFIMSQQVKTQCKGNNKTELARSLLVPRKERVRL